MTLGRQKVRNYFQVPMRRVGDAYVEATWDEAIADISGRLDRIIDRGRVFDAAARLGKNAGPHPKNRLIARHAGVSLSLARAVLRQHECDVGEEGRR